MLTIIGRNVNRSYPKAINMVKSMTKSDSRNGPVYVADHPVLTVTQHPTERVLFCPNRNANPFFHFFECLWMLSGQNDATWLDQFIKDFSKRYGEQDIMHGAYGHRWRNHFMFDQLQTAAQLLLKNPLDRRVVISMWDPVSDLRTGDDLPKDIPCNTHMYPRIRENVLDLTVCCRSNDVVWGCYGANIVHFSFVQEYLAGLTGRSVGTLYQLSNNWHAYEDTLDMVGEPTHENPYVFSDCSPSPIGEDFTCWDSDLTKFLESNGSADHHEYQNQWFWDTATQMLVSHRLFKRGELEFAIHQTERIQSSDWRRACRQWLKRKRK